MKHTQEQGHDRVAGSRGGDAGPGAECAARLEALHNLLRSFGSVCIGYSGGVDSAFLAVTALDTLGAGNVLTVNGRSPSVPSWQRERAVEIAQQFGIPFLAIDTDELLDPSYASNPANRCFFCKTELWSKLAPVARDRGLAVLLDGANADDAHDHRPGSLAAREHGVRSPLLETGLTKADIRALSKQRGLATWDQPESPCLASRLPYGVAVTPERLAQVERAEDMLRRFGFREFRVRHHEDTARVEVASAEMVRALAMAEQIHTALRTLNFTHVVLDVEGYRRGALNEGLVSLGSRV
ncbi:MAG: ATP-dependent sacrificial sulfur transferase LarE [Longimicrobiales bacterium]